jgi:hypothetical protein
MDEMMENFSYIRQRLSITTSASSSSGHFGGTSPFKVQVNFDNPVFEGQIDADIVEKWLNLLEGYFFVHNFSDREKITFTLLKSLPHVKHCWDVDYIFGQQYLVGKALPGSLSFHILLHRILRTLMELLPYI